MPYDSPMPEQLSGPGMPDPSMAPPPQMDPAKLAMIRQIMMQRMMQGGGMGQMPAPPPMLGAPPRPTAPTMLPGQPAFGGPPYGMGGLPLPR